MRKLARLVTIEKLTPIPGADVIETAHIGGWCSVVQRGDFAPGDRAVYFEVDSFLPSGNPAWQFLIDLSTREFGGVRGHVLRTITCRKQLSQGLALPMSCFSQPEVHTAEVGQDLSELLGIVQYERPIPPDLAGEVRGGFPGLVPKTDQERIQNLASEVAQWAQDGVVWEVTEKLEGASCTVVNLDGELHVCSRRLDLRETPRNTFWQVVRATDLEQRLARAYPHQLLALQGEMVGPGVEENIYKLTKHALYLYDIYDVQAGRYFTPAERREALLRLNDVDPVAWATLTGQEQVERARGWVVKHVPVLGQVALPVTDTVEQLLASADGLSQLFARPREGLVFKAVAGGHSFKAISNKYLLKQN